MIPLFDWFALAPSAGAPLPGWGELLLATASAGVVGMGLSDLASGLGERLGGGDEADEDSTDDDELASGDGGDGLGDVGDWDDDDGELDGLGDDDELNELGGGGGQSDLEPRLEDLESEVEKISSTIGTVRSENEAISETVEDIEDNIRKLLDIYEMVTRGVNPFVDEAGGGGGGGGGMSGSFGLFEDAQEDDGHDDIDPDVADADPDSFFDDDFEEGAVDDDGFDDEDFDDPGVATDPGEEDDVLGEAMASSPGSGSGDDGEGKTFDDLKSEYDSGDAEWNQDGEPDHVDAGAATVTKTEADDEGPATDASTVAEEATAPERAETTADPDDAREPEGRDDGGSPPETDAVDDTPAAEGPTGSSAGDGVAEEDSSTTDGSTASNEETEGWADLEDESSSPADTSDGKPYLESLPPGYGAELLVIEWLSYLRERSSTSEALRAIKYYQTIGWIGDAAANSLQRYLTGLADGEATPASTGGTQLTIDHHTNSLHYIGELGGEHVDVERLEWTTTDRDASSIERRGQRGIQR